MVTTVGLAFDLKNALCDLIELDFDAIGAYTKAIEKLSSEEYRNMMTQFREDHERHIKVLTEYLKDKGVQAPTEGDMKEILVKGKVYMGSLFGDRTILRAMQSNEVDTNTAYKRVLGYDNMDDHLVEMLARGFDDERRHLSWLKQTLQEGGAKP